MSEKRLFVAIPVPEATRAGFAKINLNQRGFRPAASHNIHLTLQFIGNVPNTLAANIEAELVSIQLPPFTLNVAGVGFFPSAKQPRILWAGLGQPPARLFQLQKKVEAVLLSLGIAREKRRWNPHITLARFRDVSPEAARQLAKTHREFTAAPFQVTRFALYRSELTSAGPVYTKEQSYDLTRQDVD